MGALSVVWVCGEVVTLFDKDFFAVYNQNKGAAINGRRTVTTPKGGDIYVLDAYIPYRRLLSLDQDSEAEKTKPPLPQVTVSIWC